jgi:hypothetical protein
MISAAAKDILTASLSPSVPTVFQIHFGALGASGASGTSDTFGTSGSSETKEDSLVGSLLKQEGCLMGVEPTTT